MVYQCASTGVVKGDSKWYDNKPECSGTVGRLDERVPAEGRGQGEVHNWREKIKVIEKIKIR